MRIRLVIAEFRRRMECRMLSSRLDRMAGDCGPESFRSPEFLAAEIELGIALAKLAEVEYEIGRGEPAGRCHSRAEQIYTALFRFLPNAQLAGEERMVIEKRFDRLRRALASLQNQYTTA